MCSVCKYGFDQFFRYGEVIGFGRFLGKVMVLAGFLARLWWRGCLKVWDSLPMLVLCIVMALVR